MTLAVVRRVDKKTTVTPFGSELLTPIVAQAAEIRDTVRPLFGDGVPAPELGSEGSVYYNTANPTEPVLYGPKTNGSWGAGRPLKGGPGANVMSVAVLDALPTDTVVDGTDRYQTSGFHEVGLGAANYVATIRASEPASATRKIVGPHLLTLNEPVKRIEYFGASSIGGNIRNLDCTDAMAEAREFAMERGKDGMTLVLGEGKHHIEDTQVMSKIGRFCIQGVGGRIASPHQQANLIGGSEIVNGTGGVLFDFIDDVTVAGDWHPTGIELDRVGFSQPNNATDIALRFQTQWSQPRIRRCAFLGGKHAYTFAGSHQPYDVECEDTFFFNMATACYMPDTGSSDYLHMMWRNCTWRYNDIAVESQIGNSYHFQGGLVEANRIGLKLAGALGMVELGQGLHFEQQAEQDIWIKAGTLQPSAVTKVLRIEGVTATWWPGGLRNGATLAGQAVQIQIDDALSSIIQGNGIYKPGTIPGGAAWTGILFNQPADRIVQLGSNIIDATTQYAVTNSGLIINETAQRHHGGRTNLGGAVDDGKSMLNVKGIARASEISVNDAIHLKPYGWSGAAGVAFLTDISLNAGVYAGSLLCQLSTQNNTGDVTCGALYLIILNEGGSNASTVVKAVRLGGTDGPLAAGSSTYTFSCDASGKLKVAPGIGGNHYMAAIRMDG